MPGDWSFDDFDPDDMAPSGDPEHDCDGTIRTEDIPDDGVDFPVIVADHGDGFEPGSVQVIEREYGGTGGEQ